MNSIKDQYILALLNDSSPSINQSRTNNRTNLDQLQTSAIMSVQPQTDINWQHNKDKNELIVDNNSSSSRIWPKYEQQENNCKFPNYSSESETISEPLSNEDSRVRKKFTPEEDLQLTKLIAKYGPRKWDKIALSMPGRTGRQCRDRYANYLNPSLVNGPWTEDEDILLEQKVFELGQHWNIITKFFKGRSANNIKNRWYTYLSGQKKCKQGMLSIKNNNKNNLQYENKLGEQGNYINHYDKLYNGQIYYNYGNNSEIMYLNNYNTSLNMNNFQLGTLNNIEIDPNISFVSKSENEKKILFPPIYPPMDNFAFPLNNGFLGFLNQQFVV